MRPGSPALRIDIAVGGRFHADRMAAALLSAGHSVRLFTSYPRTRFPLLTPETVHPILLPEIAYRVGLRCGLSRLGEELKLTSFGRAVARARRRSGADVLISWSGFALEAFRESRDALKILVRDSAHISEQFTILDREYARHGLAFPFSRLSEKRELEEYALADRILVLSDFAKRSFLSRGFAEEKLKVLRLSVDTNLFRPSAEWAPPRPLRLVCFGFLAFRKGIPYLLDAMERFSPGDVNLTLIGSLERGVDTLVRASRRARYLPAMAQADLARQIRDADVFVLPSLEDGFATVVPQAMASGLVPIVSRQCGAAELVENNIAGFVIEPESANAIAEKIELLLREPTRLAQMRDRAIRGASQRTWETYGHELVAFINENAAPLRSAAS